MFTFEDLEYDPTEHLAFGEWCTNDGDILLISEMKTSHIQNCVKCINSGRIKNPSLKAKILELDYELRRRKTQEAK
jgi:DNA-directed RNA polymerase subunit M/transcription elongation factor TFIIS